MSDFEIGASEVDLCLSSQFLRELTTIIKSGPTTERVMREFNGYAVQPNLLQLGVYCGITVRRAGVS